MSPDTIIISLGGSIINPGDINLSFLKNFISFVRGEVEQGKTFVIITGGGAPSREYVSAMKEYGTFSQEEMDVVGIYATRLNAVFIRTLFGDDICHPDILMHSEDLSRVEKPVAIGGGTKPGHSSDMCAVHLAGVVGSKDVINITNTTHVYDRDPNKFEDAEKIEKLSWDEYRALIPSEWKASMSTPFDPVASAQAQELGLQVVITGLSIENLQKYMQTGQIDGSIIE